MKKIFAVIICFLLASCSLPEHTSALLTKKTEIEIKRNPPAFFIARNINIVALGDSLTEGVGDGTKQGGYVGRIEKSLQNEERVKKLEVDNFGVKGYKTTDLLDKLKEKKVRSKLGKADIIVLSIGGNDVMKIVRGNILSLDFKLFQKEQKTYEKRLTRIIGEIRKKNKTAPIYFVGLYNPFKYTIPELTELDIVVDEWNKATDSILKEDEKAKFVPIADIFSLENEEQLLYKDAFHPNEIGYTLIAERVYKAIYENSR
ncbi:SGNH/GDSL hydrolase family protein [Metabacillus fastidiosus]|uniref:SGNH/GDSL hydrolase family protein n=1 Tax=Metabacillus fastidiosus TaxID=1458 RepID=UPI003D27FB69